jgi:ribosomal protein S18 acetylase RimI-like enzyme
MAQAHHPGASIDAMPPTADFLTMATTRDGRPLQIRHVTRDDEPALLAFMTALSVTSRRLRFFSAGCDLAEAALWAATADGSDRIGILATDLAGQILAHAVCCRLPGSAAEVAIEVSESQRHQGLATILIVRLAAEAEAQGIRSFVAEVLPDNREMLAVFSDGFEASRTAADGEVDIAFPTSAWRLVAGRLRRAQPSPSEPGGVVHGVAVCRAGDLVKAHEVGQAG